MIRLVSVSPLAVQLALVELLELVVVVSSWVWWASMAVAEPCSVREQSLAVAAAAAQHMTFADVAAEAAERP